MSEGGFEMQQVLDITRELATLGAKMDGVQQAVANLQNTLTTNYVPRTEIEEKFKAQGERIGKLESAPHRWVSTGIALVAAIAAVGAIFIH